MSEQRGTRIALVVLIVCACLGAAAVGLFLNLRGTNRNQVQISMSEFETLLGQNKVKSMVIDGDEISGEFNTPQQTETRARVTEFKVVYPAGTLKNTNYVATRIMNHRGDARITAVN